MDGGNLPAAIARQEWIREARRDFRPGDRQPCDVCGKYRSLAHAHHILPLAVQEGPVPNQEFVWLCPTHHAAVHLLIAQALSNRDRAGCWQIELMLDLEPDELSRVWGLFDRFRQGWQ